MKGLIRGIVVVVGVAFSCRVLIANAIDKECVKYDLNNVQTTINMYVEMGEWDMVEEYVVIRDSLKAIVK